MALFCEFLNSGALGPLHLGLSLEQATKILGSPEDHSEPHRPAYVLRYGAVQLGFSAIANTDDERLTSIAIYFDRPDREVAPLLQSTDWVPTNETTANEFREFCRGAGMELQSHGDQDEEMIELSSGASAVFMDGKLHSIHFKKTEKKTPRRQFSVSLPEETVQLLKQRAQAEHVSVPALIERLIQTGT